MNLIIVLIIHAIEYLTKNMAGKGLFDIGVGVDKLEEIKARAMLRHHHLSVISAAVSSQVLKEYIFILICDTYVEVEGRVHDVDNVNDMRVLDLKQKGDFPGNSP